MEGLQDVGYYRLSGYWYILKEPDGMFAEGTDFGRVWDLYVFDRQFRLVVLDAIERVEIYFRNQLMHRLAEDGGAFGYLDAGNFPRFDADAYRSFIGRCKTAYNRSREPFAIHFRGKYGDEHDLPPYWMIVNLMEFGTMLSKCRGASAEIRNEIAARMGFYGNWGECPFWAPWLASAEGEPTSRAASDLSGNVGCLGPLRRLLQRDHG